ncbi:hypothetical protein CTZ27_33230 [Streptomyces griseocarneus]|nr:hypothetical protein CTZ27_33230 [Streptomyces griseocarneus]
MQESFQRNPALLVAVDKVEGCQQFTMSVQDGRPPLVVDDPRLLAAVSSLPSYGFLRADVLKCWAEAGMGDVAEAMWEFCTGDTRLIVPSGTQQPHAGYHGATRNYPFLDMSTQSSFATDNQLMRSYMNADGYPSVYLELPYDSRWPLPRAEETVSRRGIRTVNDELALLVDGTLGERARRDYADDGRHLQVELIHKAVPSGGSRHPTEGLLYLRIGELPEGLYHFNVRERALDRLSCQPAATDLADACPGLAELLAEPSEALAVVLLASRVERAMWRYRDPRSFRAVVLDVGHAVQHVAELGTWLGWTWTDLPGVDTRALETHVGLDDETMPLIAAGVLRK